MRAADLRLDPLQQQAEEQILPYLALAQARTGSGRKGADSAELNPDLQI